MSDGCGSGQTSWPQIIMDVTFVPSDLEQWWYYDMGDTDLNGFPSVSISSAENWWELNGGTARN